MAPSKKGGVCTGFAFLSCGSMRPSRSPRRRGGHLHAPPRGGEHGTGAHGRAAPRCRRIPARRGRRRVPAQAPLSPIAPRGPIIAKSWHNIGPTFGENRADEALRNYIKASSYDPDYWEALNLLAIWFHEQHRPFPKRLAAWAIQCHNGGLTAPPRHRGDRGRPSYAQEKRNFVIAAVFGLLGYLGMAEKSLRYSVIAEVLECSEDTVRKGLARHATQAGTVPRPWECWPSPRR